MRIHERYQGVLSILEKQYGEAETELLYSNPFELLIAVVLSAQCTDKRVNMVTPALFNAFPTPQAMAASDSDTIFEYIRSISYPNAKSKYLHKTATMLVENHQGEVPTTVEALVKLPGVGRKTAHVITSVLYQQPNLAVDTHVFRVSARIGLTKGAKTPLHCEQQLVKHIPPEKIPLAHHWLILHGRYTCIARKPKCDECNVQNFCKKFEQNQRISKKIVKFDSETH